MTDPRDRTTGETTSGVTPRRVVVAVARSGSESAVRYGAREARRTDATLELVHVSSTDSQSFLLGNEVLDLAVAQARTLVGGGGVVLRRLVVDDVAAGLIETAENSSLVVMERRAPGTAGRAGSMTAAVARAVPVPVVSIPAGWVSEPEAGHVVAVGVDLGEGSAEVLRAALHAARLRNVALQVLASRWQVSGSVGPDRTAAGFVDDLPAVRRDLGELVASLGGDACDVALETPVGRPANMLIEASRTADLVVVGRHEPVLPRGSRLGPVAGEVLAGAQCPVLLVRGHRRTWRRGEVGREAVGAHPA